MIVTTFFPTVLLPTIKSNCTQLLEMTNNSEEYEEIKSLFNSYSIDQLPLIVRYNLNKFSSNQSFYVITRYHVFFTYIIYCFLCRSNFDAMPIQESVNGLPRPLLPSNPASRRRDLSDRHCRFLYQSIDK